MLGCKFKIQKSQGFATLMLTVVVLISLTLFAFVSANAVVTKQQAVVAQHETMSAFNAAQSGLDYAIPYLNKNYSTIEDGSTQTITLPNNAHATLRFDFVGDKNSIRVTSVGYSANDSSNKSLQQMVVYKNSQTFNTFAQAALIRSSALIGTNSMIVGRNIGDTVAVLGVPVTGTSYNFTKTGSSLAEQGVNAYWGLNNSGVYEGIFYPDLNSSKAGAKGDVVYKPEIFTGKTEEAIQRELLGKTPAELATVTSQVVVLPNSGSSGNYNNNSFVPYSNYSSFEINHKKSGASTAGTLQGVTLGSANKPITLQINIASDATLSFSNSTIIGDVVVHNGTNNFSMTNVNVTGNVIVEGRLVASNSTITGNVITTAGVLLGAGTVVRGVVYAEGGALDVAGGMVYGATIANSKTAKMQVRSGSRVVHDPSYAKIATSTGGAVSGYGKVAGSWRDL